ncbi:hypothetical protein NUW58_g9324 [Xylaria curta]|uniref:Uncharacterized protein n=1 Tax=Xylaria curta TaxID=42375 RepID=A0ACC1MZG1_9PEZI|nr:hypothetical protein NUW58_g9324 [Xylaria curta]
MATPGVVVGPNALGPTSRFSRRRAPAPMDKDKGPSLLLFVRGQDDFQAVTNAYQNSQIFNHDYGQNLTVQLRGNREAAELIRDYDLVIDFARILVEHFEIPVPIRDIHDPGNIWLTTRLREIFGDGWSSRYSRRVIFERLAEWSMRWTFTRVSNYPIPSFFPSRIELLRIGSIT